MKKINFKNSGVFTLGEVNTDELAYMAIKSDGFFIGDKEYAISFNPTEGFYMTCYDSSYDYHVYEIDCLVVEIMKVIEEELS